MKISKSNRTLSPSQFRFCAQKQERKKENFENESWLEIENAEKKSKEDEDAVDGEIELQPLMLGWTWDHHEIQIDFD